MQTFLFTKCLILFLRMTNWNTSWFFFLMRIIWELIFHFLNGIPDFRGRARPIFKRFVKQTLKKTKPQKVTYIILVYSFLYTKVYIPTNSEKMSKYITELGTVFKEHELLIMALVRILKMEVSEFITKMSQIETYYY